MNGPSNLRLKQAIVELASLRGFPRDEGTQAFLTRILLKECVDDAHVDKVVDSLTAGNSWPGPGALRTAAQDLKPRAYEPTEYERQTMRWKAEQAADLRECPAQCMAGMLRINGPRSPWTRCTCKWAAQVTDEQIEYENRVEAAAQRPRAAGLQPVLDPTEFETWQAIGEQRDRERERERMRLIRERRLLQNTPEDGAVQ